MTELLSATPIQVVAIVITTIAMYLVFVGVVRVLGQRSLAAMSTVDLVCVLAVGAVVGRTALLAEPTLGGGVVALMTLFLLQRALGHSRVGRRMGALFARRPVLLMVGTEVRDDALRSARVTRDELRQRLRLAGIARPGEVGCVVLEANGQISVVRGPDLDPLLFEDVLGAVEALRTTRRDTD